MKFKQFMKVAAGPTTVEEWLILAETTEFYQKDIHHEMMEQLTEFLLKKGWKKRPRWHDGKETAYIDPTITKAVLFEMRGTRLLISCFHYDVGEMAQ